MASPYVCRQDLGIFQKYLSPIIDAVGRVKLADRTQVGIYTVLDRGDDPKFPNEGLYKTAFFCLELLQSDLVVHVALRSKLDCVIFNREKRVITVLKGTPGVLDPLLIAKDERYEWLISKLFNQGDLVSLVDNSAYMDNSEIKDKIGYEVAQAIERCHLKGIIWRDVKCDNILVDVSADGTLRVGLIDWGLSLIVAEDSVYESKKAAGTYLYIPPEEWGAWRETSLLLPATAARDLWAFGALLFILAKGFCVGRLIPNEEHPTDIQLYPQHRCGDLGLYGEIIKEIIYKPRAERPSLSSVVARMAALFSKAYPERKVA